MRRLVQRGLPIALLAMSVSQVNAEYTFRQHIEGIRPSEIRLVATADGVAWANGTVARSCNDYLHPQAPYTYAGATGSGYYKIDPQGNGVPKKVWCDMEVEGGGWTCDGRTGATSGYSSTGYIMAYSTPSLPSLASQALLRRLFKM